MRLRAFVVVAITLAIIILLATFPIVSLVVLSALGPLIATGLRSLTIYLSNHVDKASTLYIGLGLGLGGFLLRTFALPVYAAFEIIFGTIGAGVALSLLYDPNELSESYKQIATSTSLFSQYVGLGSAIFVIVRGLDNIYSGSKPKNGKRNQNLNCVCKQT